ncbi:MAG: GNAT family N-acetyltransferase [Bacteroidetes bacterium]|nr:GNAT family N-acetyltransferase [Bacteroidota bacterium]
MNIHVRKGVKQDIPHVLELIKELALYEKEPNEVIVTIESMERDGFGSNPLFYFYVAEVEEYGVRKIIGIALYFMRYSTWKGKCVFLDDIVVTEKFRKNGVGSMLFDALLEECRAIGAKRLEWQVLDWNQPAINFYKKYQAKFMDEWLNCRLVFD